MAAISVSITPTSNVTSTFTTGVSYVDKQPIWRTPGWPNAKAALAQAVGIHNLHLFPFGQLDPWPLENADTFQPGDRPVPARPGALTGRGSLTEALQKVREIDPNATIIVTLYGGAWWMKGHRYPDGVTKPLTKADAYDDSGRIMTAYLDDWAILAHDAALVALRYGVRIFQVWNEFKGYYNNRLNKGQLWEWDDYPGTPGLHADHGYTHLYAVTVDAILKAATTLGIAHNEIEMCGPYAALRSLGKRTADSLPSTGYPDLYDRPWGTMNKMPVRAVEGFHDIVRQRGLKVDRLAIDFGTGNKDGLYPGLAGLDPLAAEWLLCAKFTDIANWAHKELARIGRPDLPLIGSEVYCSARIIDEDAAPPQLATVLKLDKHIRLLKGGITPLAWDVGHQAVDPNNAGAWILTNPATADGGKLAGWGEVYALLREHFGPGTKLYALVCSDARVDGIASDTKILVYNKSADALAVTVQGIERALNAYQVSVFDVVVEDDMTAQEIEQQIAQSIMGSGLGAQIQVAVTNVVTGLLAQDSALQAAWRARIANVVTEAVVGEYSNQIRATVQQPLSEAAVTEIATTVQTTLTSGWE